MLTIWKRSRGKGGKENEDENDDDVDALNHHDSVSTSNSTHPSSRRQGGFYDPYSLSRVTTNNNDEHTLLTTTNISTVPSTSMTPPPTNLLTTYSSDLTTYQTTPTSATETSPETEQDQWTTQIRQIQQKSLSSTQQSLAKLTELEEMAREQMVKVGEQGETLSHVQGSINESMYHATSSESKASELRRLQRWFFLPVKKAKSHETTKLTKQEKQLRKDKVAYERMVVEQETRAKVKEREKNAKELFRAKAALDSTMKKVGRSGSNNNIASSSNNDPSLAFLSSNQDQDQDQLLDKEAEVAIDKNLSDMTNSLGRLKLMAQTMGGEIERQNSVLDNVADRAEETIVRVSVAQKDVKRVLER